MNPLSLRVMDLARYLITASAMPELQAASALTDPAATSTQASKLGEIVLALMLVLLAVAFRLVIDQRVEKKDFISTMLSFPVDLNFLVLSVIVVAIIGSKGPPDSVGTAVIVTYILSIIITIVMSKRSVEFLDEQKYKLCCALTIPCYVFGGTSFYYASKFVIYGEL